ncbi:dihydrodipicolinate reductase [Roseovarius autotrophicus]|uniref:dihydrodipicolinate reductase n=1 Tax=Roseovarius autotrophicus TaxID=2824121 RepID=UPI001A00D93F|nr:dihydrodipicolinate reductase [Roseovarius autotrophicus]MBE0453761.1 dihydrodipicolinate reductase [Roseovarius sp.]
MRYAIALILLFGLALPARADFAPVTERDGFVSLISGRDLTRFGIRLKVTPDGHIRGRAFGRDVRGAWRWDGDYFCRSLYWGEMDLGPNCQAVRLNGDTIRFISDQGTGQFADLYLR